MRTHTQSEEAKKLRGAYLILIYPLTPPPTASLPRRRLPSHCIPRSLVTKVNKELDTIREHMLGDGDKDAFSALPEDGVSHDEIISKAEALKDGEDGLSSGKKWAGIYYDTSKDKEQSSLKAIQGTLWSMCVGERLVEA